jgi:PAS domain S-box-containing protein
MTDSEVADQAGSQTWDVDPCRFQTILNSISDGVFAVDDKWRITCFNRAAEQTLGITREQAVGRLCHEVLRANICRDACALRYTMETGHPVVNLAVHLTDSSNRRVPVTISTAVVRDDQGNIIGGVETFRNLALVRKMLEEIERDHPFEDFVTADPYIRHLFEILPTMARSESCILIRGETGTGKSLLARIAHRLSDRREGPLITVSCGSLPETLLESELFGYKAGAFTGAVKDRAGRIAAAEGGTLFLDEIGDLPLAMQVKLLRFLQDHVYERLGDPAPRKADVRLVTATNQDLKQRIEAGAFRRDLYYRINVLSVEISPLRDRLNDVPLLAQHFLERFSMLRGKQVTGISPRALDLLMQYDFPGNVRELENIVEHAFVFCPGAEIGVEHLPDPIRGQEGAGPPSPSSMDDLEARFLVDALRRNDWHRARTARQLGMHRTTLLRKIRKHGIALPATDGRAARRRKAGLAE